MNSEDCSAEPLIAFLDANIILEGKPVADLPWEEVTSEGTIRVLIVPKAMEEIDAKKRDGRLGPHARSFNRLIAPSVIENRPIILRETNPRVELEMAKCSRIPWQQYDDLDPDDGDSRIVAEAINVRGITSTRRVLISHDIKPLAYASGRQLSVHQASDTWLRPVEPSPKDKEIQRLKQQLSEFKKDEPTFEISVNISSDSPAKIYDISPLKAMEMEEITNTIRSLNPRKNQRRDQFSVGMSDYDSSYDRKYQSYTSKHVPNFVSSLSSNLQILFNQRILNVMIKNNGQIRADHLVISIKTNDGWINDKLVVVSPKGPRAPVPKPAWDSLQQLPTFRNLIPARVGRHEFEVIQPAKRAVNTEESCEDFRSGQEYYFKGIIVPSTEPKPLEISVVLTAANLRGQRAETFELRKQIFSASASDLVDMKMLVFRQDFEVKNEMERIIAQERFDDIEWAKYTSDD